MTIHTMQVISLKASFVPSSSTSLAEMVADQILDAIMSHQLVGGDRLIETDLDAPFRRPFSKSPTCLCSIHSGLRSLATPSSYSPSKPSAIRNSAGSLPNTAVISIRFLRASQQRSTRRSDCPRLVSSDTLAFAKASGLWILIWEGYAEPDWVKPFEKENGVKCQVAYFGSVDETFANMQWPKGADFDVFAFDTSTF